MKTFRILIVAMVLGGATLVQAQDQRLFQNNASYNNQQQKTKPKEEKVLFGIGYTSLQFVQKLGTSFTPQELDYSLEVINFYITRWLSPYLGLEASLGFGLGSITTSFSTNASTFNYESKVKNHYALALLLGYNTKKYRVGLKVASYDGDVETTTSSAQANSSQTSSISDTGYSLFAGYKLRQGGEVFFEYGKAYDKNDVSIDQLSLGYKKAF